MRIISVLILAAALVVACGPKSTATLHALGSCAASATEDIILPTVKSVLENGAPANWEAQLEALGVAYGKDVLLCTVAEAGKQFAAKAGGDTTAGTGAGRAKMYLEHQGYRASIAPPPNAGNGAALRDSQITDDVTTISTSVTALTVSLVSTVDGVGCESPNAMPAVNCINGSMAYDGCHWACRQIELLTE